MKNQKDIDKRVIITISLSLLIILVIAIVLGIITYKSSFELEEPADEKATEIVLFPEQEVHEEVIEEETAIETEKTKVRMSDEDILTLGKLCFVGESIKQDYDIAASCFYSVSKESAEASYALGLMYIYGMGVPVDHKKAEAYLLHASELGHENAFKAIEKLNVSKQVNDTLTYELSYIYDFDEDIDDKIENIDFNNIDVTTFDNELDKLLKGDYVIAPSMVIYGKDNWLFNQCRTDGNSFADYISDNEHYYSQKEMEAIGDNLKKMEKYINDNGAEFYIMIIPNKENVYDDYMPQYMKDNRKNEVTRVDILVDYLEEQGLNIVYLKDEFLKEKEEAILYYSTDTHCNMKGSFVALQMLIRSIDETNDIKIMDKYFDEHLQDYCGDLGNTANNKERYSKDVVYYMPDGRAFEEDKLDKSLLLLGDSFGEFINIEAGYYFKKGVTFDMVLNYNYSYSSATDVYIKKKKPDIVVWELTERYADRLR